ncbi:Ferri-bacillibactin esterase BesA [Serratia quinivorans]|jgi:predicted alpha/beta superfamily hydrolase|uniref:alpha/beta hydrolase n=1 Tax=Serratia quinivorans TaxID=137545 RepID=UPI0021798ED1|nr:alpha/beta hydrolase [Serratia quinivorans]CAI0991237.1 Ferri-bacillibactin esterase BesA [Serratia quinivorans]CAI1006036.1 Ferri-bacillibactin esterase BesA [Serratia quinivorans]CAI1041609.1 Ferri-bacillibactin esterase BesA [Serratia quinivorans]CAI1056583.1 Ferri-bacillibactin esterase BesA [Serratia quinivorans]CAI1129163.1 Ferri-bacillibactin esterase BesA [Serratia quinivorans]
MPSYYLRCLTLVFTLIVGVGSPMLAQARPDLERKIGVTVADSPSPDYQFSDLRFNSADGQRHYRIRIAQPRNAPPAAGYPVVYLLDGNAVLMELNASLLARLAAQKQPPVLVLLSYDNDLRIDANGRSYDYTPAPLQTGEMRANGGADAFLKLIESQIKPAVAAKVAIDPQRQTLWGHSYGGLFVLHTLLTQPAAFQNYVAVEPSLWWGKGFILQEAQRVIEQHPAMSAHLWLWTGGGEKMRSAPPNIKQQPLPADAAQRLTERLATLNGLTVTFREWPGLDHGAMFSAAIAPALDEIAKGG